MSTLRDKRCPCGSGKKFKNCCDKQMNSIVLRLKYRFHSFSTSSVIEIIAGLMTMPENHSQTYRLKIAMQAAIINDSSSQTPITPLELEDIFLQELPSFEKIGRLEDPQETLFTTIISTHGGNYIIYPEVFQNEALCLQNMLHALFATENHLPEPFLDDIYSAYNLLLAISNHVAEQLGHKRYMASPDRHGKEIYLPDIIECHIHTKAISISLSKQEENILIDFICDSSNPELTQESHEKSPLHTRPFVKIGNNFFLASVHNICSALIGFIVKKAFEYKSMPELLAEYRVVVKQHLSENLLKIGFGFNSQFSVTAKEHPLFNMDAVFEFDSDKLAYVRVIIDEFNDYHPNHYSLGNQIFEPKKLIERERDILENQIPKIAPDSQVLLLNIYVSSGREFVPLTKNKIYPEISMTLSEFQTLMLNDDFDNLSLWKLSLAEKDIPATTRIKSFSFLDKYAFYLEHDHSFYFSDNDQSGERGIFPGYANELRHKLHLAKDIHFEIFTDNTLIEVKRKHRSPKIPIYNPTAPELNPLRIIQIDKKVILVKPTVVKQAGINNFYSSIMEACAYWLWQISPFLKTLFQHINKRAVTLEVDIQNPKEIKNLKAGQTPPDRVLKDFRLGIDEDSSWISIPNSWFDLAYLENNQADRTLLKAILASISLLLPKEKRPTLEQADEQIDKYAPLGLKSMLQSYFGNESVFLDSSALPKARINSVPEFAIILNNLVIKAGLKLPIGPINSIKIKKQTCNQIVGFFFSEVQKLIRLFPTIELLRSILHLNEAIWQKKHSDSARLPSLLACFEKIDITRNELIEKSMKLDEAANAHRALIEFIISTPSTGLKKINEQDTDMMLALAKEIIVWGMLSDDLDSGLDDTAMGILESGRVGTGKYFNSQVIRPYAEKKRQEEIIQRIEESEGKLESRDETISTEIDNIFLAEFGVKKSDFNSIIFLLHLLNRESRDVVMEIDYTALIKKMALKLGFEKQTIKNAIEILCLENRAVWEEIPAELKRTDIYPWRYSRQLSHLRRPLIKFNQKGKTTIYFGYRQLILSYQYLQEQINTGRYQANSSEMKTHIGRILKQRGEIFNNKIFKWLKSQLPSDRYQIYKGVKPNKINKTTTQDNFGDIDLLIIDNLHKVFISVECKNVNAARTSSEIYAELNRFEKEWIEKHLKRDRWIKNNPELIMDYYNLAKEETFSSISIFVTSEAIPYPFIRKKFKDLIFKDFEEMKRCENITAYFDSIINTN